MISHGDAGRQVETIFFKQKCHESEVLDSHFTEVSDALHLAVVQISHFPSPHGLFLRI